MKNRNCARNANKTLIIECSIAQAFIKNLKIH